MTDNQHEVNQALGLVNYKPQWVQAFNYLAELANKNARHKGFYEDQEWVQAAVEGDIPSWRDKGPKGWLKSTALQASIARMHEELSEAVQAVRKGNPSDDHLPQYSGLEADLADVIIRILDCAGEHKLKVGGAVIDKMLYNSKRPHKHGKNS